MTVERKHYPHLDAPVGPYVHATKLNNLLFVSGLTAFNTPAQQGSMLQQAEVILKQLKGILDAEGVGFEHMAKVTIFVTELEGLPKIRELAIRYYGDFFPASSLVEVKNLFSPDLKIEIEAVVGLD